MDWIVTTARTVEDAQARALDLLGVDSDDAEVQVLEEGKTGLFGRTKTEARVRARIRPKAPPSREERRGGGRNDRNRGRNNRGGKGGGNNRNQGGGNNRGGKGGGTNRNQGGGSGGGNNRNQGGGNNDGGNNRGGKGGGNNRNQGGGNNRGGKGGNNNNDGGGNRSRRGQQAAAAGAGAAAGAAAGRGRGGRRNDRNDEDRVEMPVEEQRTALLAFAEGVAAGFDPDATVELVEEGTTLQARVNGDNVGRLVGPKANALHAFEELARTAMHRAADGRRYHRIQVDVDDYRLRRREALVRFATQTAEQVAASGERVAMDPMGAADRKIVHDAVGEVDGVETMSEGRDPRRYIVLVPVGSDEEE